MANKWHLKDALDRYRAQGAPQNQQVLIALLQEVQAEKGGVLPQKSLNKIAERYALKPSLLSALIRQIPDLRTEDAPHHLEIFGKKSCRKNGAGKLAAFVEATYDVKDGGVSSNGTFTYCTTHCLKKCGKGPVIRWDQTLYPHADEALIRSLVEGHAGKP